MAGFSEKFSLWMNATPQSQTQTVSLRDLWLVFLLTFLGFLSRIWALHQPAEPTIQEHHYGFLMNSFGKGSPVMDNQPPLWQLIMGFHAHCSEYRQNIPFGKSDFAYKEKIYPTLRFINGCLAGFVPVFTYLTLRLYGVGLYISITATVMIFCETSLIAEGRLISIEGAYQFFASLSILAVTSMYKHSSPVSVLFAGVCYGLLLSTKFEGIYFLPFIVTFCFRSSREQIDDEVLPGSRARVKQQLKRTIIEVLVIISIAMVTFYSVMKLYLSNFSVTNENVPRMIWNQTKARWNHKSGVERDLRYRASPLGLLFGCAPMYVMWSNEDLCFSTRINCFNAISSIVSVVSCFVLILRTRSMKDKTIPFAYGYVCYCVFMVLEKKPLFSSDFGICLIFGILTFASFLEFSCPRWISGFLATICVFLVFCGFVLWAPWAYGLPVVLGH